MSVYELFIILYIVIFVVVAIASLILGKLVLKNYRLSFTVLPTLVLWLVCIPIINAGICRNSVKEEVVATYDLLDNSYLATNTGRNNTAVYVCYKTDDNEIRKWNVLGKNLYTDDGDSRVELLKIYYKNGIYSYDKRLYINE
jgi:hypothetical protein